MTEIEEHAIEFIEWWANEYCINDFTDIECPYIRDLYIAVVTMKEG